MRLEKDHLVLGAELQKCPCESFCLELEFGEARIGSGVIKTGGKAAKVWSSVVQRKAQRDGFEYSGMLADGMGIGGVQKNPTMCSQFTVMLWRMLCNGKMPRG
mmetsp:Transcript_4194/g.10161  ORF Transcript_4194/g.10161 Transcript_4194/m.10161 type:complete len:103 (-) Transcript_4194:4753-5061(-)